NRRGPFRTARRDRGHHRALHDPAGFHPAHPARPRFDHHRLEASRSPAPEGSGGCTVSPDARGRLMVARRGFLKMLGGLLIAGFGTGAYAVGIEPLSRPRVTRYGVNPTGWPQGLKLRIVALADFHACEPWMPARRI